MKDSKRMRPEKLAIMQEVTSRLQGAQFAFVLNYGGLTVTDMGELRKLLRPLGSRVMVVKNTILGKAVRDQGWQDISSFLSGPTALISGAGDAAEAAKAIMGFVKTHDKSSVKGASLDKAALTAADVEALSKLPSKDALRAMLLGTLQAPASKLVRVLNAPATNLLFALKAYEDKKNGSAA